MTGAELCLATRAVGFGPTDFGARTATSEVGTSAQEHWQGTHGA